MKFSKPVDEKFKWVILFLLFIGVFLVAKGQPPKGVVIGIYFIGYGLFRFIIEFIRFDYRGSVVGGLHPSQWISLAGAILGSIMLYRIYKPGRIKS